MTQPQKQNADRGKEPAPTARQPGPMTSGPEALLQEPDLTELQRTLADLSMASPSDIAALQKTAGNRAVGERMAQSTKRPSPRRETLQRHCWEMADVQKESFSDWSKAEHPPNPAMAQYRLQDADVETRSTFFAPANDPRVPYKQIAEDGRVDEDEVRQLVAVKKKWTRDWRFLVRYAVDAGKDKEPYEGDIGPQYEDELDKTYQGGGRQTVYPPERNAVKVDSIKISPQAVGKAESKGLPWE